MGLAANLSEGINPLSKGNVLPAGPIIANNALSLLYQSNIDGPLQQLYIQNNGATAVCICVNDDATALKYNKVLKACAVAGDGSGGDFNIDMGGQVTKVTAFGTGAYTLGILKITNKINTRY